MSVGKTIMMLAGAKNTSIIVIIPGFCRIMTSVAISRAGKPALVVTNLNLKEVLYLCIQDSGCIHGIDCLYLGLSLLSLPLLQSRT